MSEAGDAQDDGQGEELFEHHRLVADPGQAPLRVDKFSINRVAHLSRNKLQTAAKSGYVRVNGEPVKSNHKVKPEDVVTVERPQPVYELELLPQPMHLDPAHEHDHVRTSAYRADVRPSLALLGPCSVTVLAIHSICL